MNRSWFGLELVIAANGSLQHPNLGHAPYHSNTEHTCRYVFPNFDLHCLFLMISWSCDTFKASLFKPGSCLLLRGGEVWFPWSSHNDSPCRCADLLTVNCRYPLYCNRNYFVAFRKMHKFSHSVAVLATFVNRCRWLDLVWSPCWGRDFTNVPQEQLSSLFTFHLLINKTNLPTVRIKQFEKIKLRCRDTFLSIKWQ